MKITGMRFIAREETDPADSMLTIKVKVLQCEQTETEYFGGMPSENSKWVDVPTVSEVQTPEAK